MSNMKFPPSLLLVSMFVLAFGVASGSCSRKRTTAPPSTAPRDEPAPRPVSPPPEGSPPAVAATVNGMAILEDDVNALVSARQLERRAALKLLVEAELVAAEARRNGFPVEQGEDRFHVSGQYLSTVYSEQTLCGNITSREISDFYEMVYKPDWPADIYRGKVIQVRCCDSLDEDCDAGPVLECMEINRGVLEELEQVRKEWLATGEAGIGALKRRHPLLEATDFGFLVWRDVPLEEQKRKRLLDPASLRVVTALKPGDISPPTESALGYHLFRLDNLRPAIEPKSPELAAAARKTICAARIEETRNRYIQELIKNADLVLADEK